MKTVRAKFLNVDLDVKSATNLESLANEWGGRVDSLHTGRVGRRHWRRFGLWRPVSPSRAIRQYARLVGRLLPAARRVWDGAAKEFDIGIHAGFERNASEWVLDAAVVRAAAELGASLRVTVYSPLLMMEPEAKRRLPGKAVPGGSRRSRA